MPREGLDVAPAGVAAVLGSLRPARGRRRTTCPRCSRSWPARRGRPAGARWSCAPEPSSGSPSRCAARACGLKPSAEYCLHRLDLRPELAEIFRRFHHSSTQRADSPRRARGPHLRGGDVGPVARELLSTAADDAPPARIAAAAARLVSQPGGVSGRPGGDPRGEQGRPADREHPDAVVQEDDVLQVRRVGRGASPPGRHAVSVLAGDSGCAGARVRGAGPGPLGPRSTRADRVQGSPGRDAIDVDLLPLPGEAARRGAQRLDVPRRPAACSRTCPMRRWTSPGGCSTSTSVSATPSIDRSIHRSNRDERAYSVS